MQLLKGELERQNVVYLELTDGRILEYNLVREHLLSNGIPYRTSFRSDFRNGGIKIEPGDICDGNILFVHKVLHSIRKKPPFIDTYPELLRPYLNRGIWETTIADVPTDFKGFIKPKNKVKLFTGFVHDEGKLDLSKYGNDTKVYLSETVKWKTEWRFYFLHGELVARACYEGDESLMPDVDVVLSANNAFKNIAPVAYCLDFGITGRGITSLIEYNDSYAIGWYLDDQIDVYWRMISERFKEMTGL